jgi:hypothetical protein
MFLTAEGLNISGRSIPAFSSRAECLFLSFSKV